MGSAQFAVSLRGSKAGALPTTQAGEGEGEEVGEA